MTYVAGSGDVVAKRSLWRVSIVSDVFWGVVNFIGLFASSIFSNPAAIRASASRSGGGGTSGSRGGGGSSGSGGGAPRRPMGRISHQGPINQPKGVELTPELVEMVTEELEAIAQLVFDADECDALCIGVTERLQELWEELQQSSDRDVFVKHRAVPRLRGATVRCKDYITHHSNKKLLQRLVASRSAAEGARQFHEEIDAAEQQTQVGELVDNAYQELGSDLTPKLLNEVLYNFQYESEIQRLKHILQQSREQETACRKANAVPPLELPCSRCGELNSEFEVFCRECGNDIEIIRANPL
ncbi:hypothetical protein PybrP1_011976 [[Pythium] brassicae (nom. inval.)]|nr:hypothetical protein PybrP1_011976 [[Pythium] brassicae (nom. inval.)]